MYPIFKELILLLEVRIDLFFFILLNISCLIFCVFRRLVAKVLELNGCARAFVIQKH